MPHGSPVDFQRSTEQKHCTVVERGVALARAEANSRHEGRLTLIIGTCGMRKDAPVSKMGPQDSIG